MKKVLLSGGLILLFVLYGLHERREQTQALASVAATVPAREDESPPPGTATPVTPGRYRDGSYIGPVTDAFYGDLQVKATVSGGRLVKVQFLQYPNDRGTSVQINSRAMVLLEREAIQAQSAAVDIVSGASDTSQAFRESLAAALDQAS